MWCNKIVYHDCLSSSAACTGAGLGSSPCCGRLICHEKGTTVALARGSFGSWDCMCPITVPAVGSAKGWAGSWPLLVPNPVRGLLSVACVPSLSPAVCWKVVLAFGIPEAAAEPSIWGEKHSTLCREVRTSAAHQGCVNPCSVLIHALC